MIGPTNRKNKLTFDGDPVPDTDSGSLLHFRHHYRIEDFRFISISYSHRPIFTRLQNPEYFGSDPADIRIGIRINPEIRIRIQDHFCLRLDELAKVCAL